jgi:G:T-mismatch repair DNA endonuclease (very short patch repair protein)
MTVTTVAEVEQSAMSKNEANYANALLRLQIEFDMQVPIGIWGMRGSQKIDIVAYVQPKKKAIFIQGAYWHGVRNSTEDQLKQAAAEDAGYVVLLVSEVDSDTFEAALQHAQENVL